LQVKLLVWPEGVDTRLPMDREDLDPAVGIILRLRKWPFEGVFRIAE